jgi:hypothetical protein
MSGSVGALEVVVFLKGLNEVLLFTVLGQGVLWLLSGPSRHTNFVYRAFQTATGPLFGLVRSVTPRFVADRHIPAVAAIGLLLIEGALVIAKIRIILMAG